MAFSMALNIAFSHGVMAMVRASGTDMFATFDTGTMSYVTEAKG